MDEEIPESWPGEPPQELALFALAGVWLFPYVILPLHVFEERYKAMIEDNLDGAGRIVLGTVRAGHEGDMEGNPPIYPIACLGEIGRHDRLADGRYNILLVGLRRVRVDEIESDRPYRMVRVETAHEIPTPPDVEPELRAKLTAAILERTEGQTSIPPEVSISHLADLLTLRMSLPPDVTAELFAELEEEKRARAALREHAQRSK